MSRWQQFYISRNQNNSINSEYCRCLWLTRTIMNADAREASRGAV